MQGNSTFSKILSNKAANQKDQGKGKDKNSWKNERTKNREQKRNWGE